MVKYLVIGLINNGIIQEYDLSDDSGKLGIKMELCSLSQNHSNLSICA